MKKKIKRWILLGVLIIPVAALANMRFPSPPTAVTFQKNGVNIRPPFEIEISCFEARDGSLWGSPSKDSCTENPCSNGATAGMMLEQNNLKDKYLSKCSLKVIVPGTSSKSEMIIEQLDLEKILHCESAGISASSLRCYATVDIQTTK